MTVHEINPDKLCRALFVVQNPDGSLWHIPLCEPNTPAEDAILWRYTSLDRLTALIASKRLSLVRLDRFTDWAEGMMPKTIREWIDEDEDGWGLRKESSRFEKQARTRMFASCWCELMHESEVLWRAYGGPTGVAIRSTVKRLVSQLHANMSVTRVFYGDDPPVHETYANEHGFPCTRKMLSTWRLAMWKRIYFRDEHEVRVLVEYRTDEVASQDFCVLGWPVDPNDLIQSVLVSPYADEATFEKAKRLLADHDMERKLLRSEMNPK